MIRQGVVSPADETLLDELISLYGEELKRTAFLYVHDLALAEDIIQEVFISCYKNIDKFNHNSSYKTWLYRITINKCKDYRKKWSLRNIFYKPETETLNQEFENSALDHYEKIEIQQQVVKAISKLPTKYKEVLIFYYYQEMTMSEISEITNTKINTVKSRVTRGRAILKTELERRGFLYE